MPAATRSHIERMEQFSVVAAQQLHAQGDPLVPLPGEHSHVSGVERGLKHVLLMAVVVNVALEKLQREV